MRSWKFPTLLFLYSLLSPPCMKSFMARVNESIHSSKLSEESYVYFVRLQSFIISVLLLSVVGCVSKRLRKEAFRFCRNSLHAHSNPLVLCILWGRSSFLIVESTSIFEGSSITTSSDHLSNFCTSLGVPGITLTMTPVVTSSIGSSKTIF